MALYKFSPEKGSVVFRNGKQIVRKGDECELKEDRAAELNAIPGHRAEGGKPGLTLVKKARR